MPSSNVASMCYESLPRTLNKASESDSRSSREPRACGTGPRLLIDDQGVLLRYSALTGGQIQFYAATAGRETATLVALNLSGPVESRNFPPPPMNQLAQLVPLQESSLALVGTLLTVSLTPITVDTAPAPGRASEALTTVAFAPRRLVHLKVVCDRDFGPAVAVELSRPEPSCCGRAAHEPGRIVPRTMGLRPHADRSPGHFRIALEVETRDFEISMGHITIGENRHVEVDPSAPAAIDLNPEIGMVTIHPCGGI